MLFVREVISENNSAILIIPISRWQLLSSRHEIRRGHKIAKYMCVFVFHKTHAVRNLGSSQSCRLVKSMNVFENEKKIVSLFFVKAKTKEGKKAFSCEAAADLALRNKGSFFNQDEWLQEFEEHERKLNTSEK